MRKVTIALTLVIALAAVVESADTRIKGRVYAHWTSDMVDGSNEFALSRTYLTVRSKLSEFTSLRLTSDLRESVDNNGKTRYDLILKYGYIDWKPAFGDGLFTIRFGLQPTQYIDFQNKLWGRRYLSKTITDKNNYLTSSDLGLSAIYSLGAHNEAGLLVISLLNGTSYNALGEMNKQKDINLFVSLNPLHNNEYFKRSAVSAQIYSGTQNKSIMGNLSASDFKRDLISISGLLAYRQLFDYGVDLNRIIFGQGFNVNEKKITAVSLFATLYLKEMTSESSLLNNTNLFARIDLVNDDENNMNTSGNNDDNTHIITGIELVPVNGFKASLNIRYTDYDDAAKPTAKELYFNTLFKF